MIENKTHKSMKIVLSGVLNEIKKVEKTTLIKLVGDQGMIVWCFLNSDENYQNLIGKKINASGFMNKKPIYAEDMETILGFESAFNIYKINEPIQRFKGKK